MPKISVIIPVYNVAKYLRECLDSVCAQTFRDFEVICVDDGSTDSSPAILDEYVAKDSRFRIIHREHSNAGACRNAGLDVAKGEFLSFLDSDDIFAPEMLEKMFDAAKKHHAEISTCRMVRFQDGNAVPRLNKRCLDNDDREYNCPAAAFDIYSIWGGRAWDKMFQKRLIDKEGLRFQEIRSANDTQFTYSALSLAEKIVSIPSTLIAYRVSSGSLERTRHFSASCVGEAIQSYALEMNRRGIFHKYPSLVRYFKLWVVFIQFWNMDTIATLDGYEKAYSVFLNLCNEFNLQTVIDDCKCRNKIIGERLQKICEGYSSVESLLFARNILRHEVEELRLLRGIDQTYAYRIGRMITWFPRQIRRFLCRY